MPTRAEIRKAIRARRRALEPRQRHAAASALARQLAHTHLLRASRHVACYLASDGEIDLQPLMRRLWSMGKRCYLPVLSAGHDKRLWFAPYAPDTPLRENRYGIPEPATPARDWLDPRQLDLVLAPLVAFDARGHRLGMGGGYYDRSFAFLLQAHRCRGPRLIGVAYAFQQVAALDGEPWDVPLHAVATETGYLRFRG